MSIASPEPQVRFSNHCVERYVERLRPGDGPGRNTLRVLMPTAYERTYEIAVAALERQHRALADARTQIPPVAAAATVLGVALAPGAFKAPGILHTISASLGAVGAVLVLVGAVATLFAGEQPGVNAIALYEQATKDDSDLFHLEAATVFSERRKLNKRGTARARFFLALALVGLIAEVAGFVVAVAV